MEIDKILICTYEYPPYCSSGAGNVAYNIANQLLKRGVECTICSPTGPDIALCNRNRVEWLYNHNKPLYYLYKILYFWYRASNYVKKNYDKYEVIWLHNPNPVPFLFKKDIYQKMNYLVTVHSTYHGFFSLSQRLNYPVSLRLYHRIMSTFERYFYNNIIDSTKITVVSPKTRNELRAVGVNVKKVRYIPNGVDINKFKLSLNKKKLRQKFNLPEDNMIILNIGRLSRHKQPYKLIEVFSLIKEHINDTILIIAGTGELLGDLKSFCHQKNLNNVKFFGYVPNEDLSNLYACSDYFIISSEYEGGEPVLTVAEAMASGLPCIVSDISNLRFIKGAKSGIVVDFNDVGNAAKKIVGYLEGDNSEHSKNAREYALNNLDWGIIAERYLDEFEKVLSDEE